MGYNGNEWRNHGDTMQMYIPYTTKNTVSRLPTKYNGLSSFYLPKLPWAPAEDFPMCKCSLHLTRKRNYPRPSAGTKQRNQGKKLQSKMRLSSFWRVLPCFWQKVGYPNQAVRPRTESESRHPICTTPLGWIFSPFFAPTGKERFKFTTYIRAPWKSHCTAQWLQIFEIPSKSPFFSKSTEITWSPLSDLSSIWEIETTPTRVGDHYTRWWSCGDSMGLAEIP